MSSKAIGEGFHSFGGPILAGHTYSPYSAVDKVTTRDLLSGRGIATVVPPSLRVGHATEFKDIAGIVELYSTCLLYKRKSDLF